MGQIPLRQIYSGDKEKFDAFKSSLMFDMHCCLPCVVQEFDRETMTVSAQPTIRERIVGESGQIQYTNYPLLINVPVVQYGNKNLRLSFPIEKGDECLVIFSDLSIDNWWISGDIQNPVEQRRHDLSDGFAIFGIMNQERMKEYNGNFEPPKDGLSLCDTESGVGITVTDGDVLLTGFVKGALGSYSLNGLLDLIYG